jgi:hypothetical protein
LKVALAAVQNQARLQPAGQQQQAQLQQARAGAAAQVKPESPYADLIQRVRMQVLSNPPNRTEAVPVGWDDRTSDSIC